MSLMNLQWKAICGNGLIIGMVGSKNICRGSPYLQQETRHSVFCHLMKLFFLRMAAKMVCFE